MLIFLGRAGNRKLAPKVSPKTWAGVYGGMITSVAISIVITTMWLQHHSLIDWLWLLVLSVMVIIVSVVGDLFESMMKRYRGIKDSSRLLPGMVVFWIVSIHCVLRLLCLFFCGVCYLHE